MSVIYPLFRLNAFVIHDFLANFILLRDHNLTGAYRLNLTNSINEITTIYYCVPIYQVSDVIEIRLFIKIFTVPTIVIFQFRLISVLMAQKTGKLDDHRHPMKQFRILFGKLMVGLVIANY